MEVATSPATSPIRVFIVDSHRLYRAGLRLLIERAPGIQVVGEAETLSQALAIPSHELANIILFDLFVGGEAELEDIPRLLAATRDARLLCVTAAPNPDTERSAVKLGAMGLVSKHSSPELLIKAIQKVHLGEAWLDRCTVANVLSEMSRPLKEEPCDEVAQIESLTRRERDIIRLVSRGYKNKQVASHLSISDVTVRHHLTSVFGKLSLTDRFELIIYAYKNGLSDSGDGFESEAGNARRTEGPASRPIAAWGAADASRIAARR